MRSTAPSSRPRPARRHPRPAYDLRALGRNDLPPTITAGGRTWTLLKTVKHDFFAATGFYHDATTGERVVLKIGRTADWAGVPLAWLGRFLRRRETRFYERLKDLPNVPPVLGLVGETGFVHAYVVGQPLSKQVPIPDGFFEKLDELMIELHRRNIAYVDTNKPQNILLGDDGLPHLIDFQISWDLTELGNNLFNRWLLRRLQREDLYHIRKHKRRLRPDLMTEKEKVEAKRKSKLIQLHRWLFKPYFLLRRRTFKRMRDSGQLLPEGSK